MWTSPALFPLLLALAAPARAAETFAGASYYVGDLHVHTGYSGDGGSADLGDCTGSCGDWASVFDTAKANGLDFVAITDHVNGSPAMSALEWPVVRDAVLAADAPDDGFVTIPGGEVWFTVRGTGQWLGHKTLLLFADDAALADLELTAVRPNAGSTVGACEEIWTWMEGLAAARGDVMLLPHHPAVLTPMYTEWSCHDPVWEPAVEIYSEHGNSLDDSGYDTPGAGLAADHTARVALDPDRYAFTFGFVGGTDSHDTRPGAVCDLDTEHPTHLYGGGLTVAVLDEGARFDRAAIGEAIRDRRTYVTTGPTLPLDVAWSAGGHRLGGLGAALDAPETLDLDVVVRVPADRAGHVLAVSVVGPWGEWPLLDDGAGRWTGSVPAGEEPPWVFVAAQIDGASWYGAEGGCDDGGDAYEWLWGSPSTVVRFDDDADDDGVSVWDGDCDDTRATVYPGAPDAWYDGVDANCDGAPDFDQDGDGWDALAGGGPDCADTDPAIHPDAPETWYDGVDQDCDGASDWDQDGDGHATAAFGGDDCDDADAAVFPGAPEAWYDGVDQDCDPATEFDADGDGARFPYDCDDRDPAVRACPAVSVTHSGCITGPPTASLLALGLALAAVRRRVRA